MNKLDKQRCISIVVPCYNEEDVFPLLRVKLIELADQLEIMNYEVEILLVNDGSHDLTWTKIALLVSEDVRFRGISLARNFGHQNALTAGLERAKGDAAVVIDADIQDPPLLIIEMIHAWNEGYEIVYGQRQTRQGETWFKLFSARWFYRLMRILSQDPTPEGVGDFYLISRRTLDQLLHLQEHHRYLRGMLFWLGFPRKAIYYDREKRKAGGTKFNIHRMICFGLDGLLSSSSFPLSLAAYVGFVSALIGLGLALWVVYVKVFIPEQTVWGWASTMIAILFLGGVQLICIGILGLYISRIYSESRNRPHYIIQEEIPASPKAS